MNRLLWKCFNHYNLFENMGPSAVITMHLLALASSFLKLNVIMMISQTNSIGRQCSSL